MMLGDKLESSAGAGWALGFLPELRATPSLLEVSAWCIVITTFAGSMATITKPNTAGPTVAAFIHRFRTTPSPPYKFSITELSSAWCLYRGITKAADMQRCQNASCTNTLNERVLSELGDIPPSSSPNRRCNLARTVLPGRGREK